MLIKSCTYTFKLMSPNKAFLGLLSLLSGEDAKAVVDGNIITSQGPGTSLLGSYRKPLGSKLTGLVGVLPRILFSFLLFTLKIAINTH